jgi:CspA family cold shock protein
MRLRLRSIVPAPPQVISRLLSRSRISQAAPEACQYANFVLQSGSQSEFGRSTVRFATWKLTEQLTGKPNKASKSPFVTWHAWRGRVFFMARSRRQAMPKGTVKWFNPTKGYGFIKPNGGDKDVFVHISAVERAGLTTLNENQVVEYDLVENRGKSSAENLKVS